jgi:7-carboxy-7-deazaguanine synthase
MALPLEVISESAAARVAALKGLGDDEVVVHEVYASLQGEGTHAGLPCAFVRTTGCHLRCVYCDTPHAFHEGERRNVDDLIKEVRGLRTRLVLVTGGEPLLQRATPALLEGLCDEGLEVLLETSGAVSTERVDERVRIILDVKTPGSGEVDHNLEQNLERLRPHDEVKYVICGEADYDWAKEHVLVHHLADRCAVLFSPEAECMDPTRLAERIVEDRLPVRLQLQLHKHLWGERRGV